LLGFIRVSGRFSALPIKVPTDRKALAFQSDVPVAELRTVEQNWFARTALGLRGPASR